MGNSGSTPYEEPLVDDEGDVFYDAPEEQPGTPYVEVIGSRAANMKSRAIRAGGIVKKTHKGFSQGMSYADKPIRWYLKYYDNKPVVYMGKKTTKLQLYDQFYKGNQELSKLFNAIESGT